MKLTGFLLVSFFAFMACQRENTGNANKIEVNTDYSTITINLESNIPEDQYAKRFHIYILNGDSLRQNQSPIIGNYQLKGRALTFSPAYPFLKGNSYLVRFSDDKTVYKKEFNIPLASLEGNTHVTNVYPSGKLLPINVLKLYIVFDEPMAAGFAYENIAIVDSQKDTLKDVFLELEEELWSSDMRRLTILFDPGRIKQGLESFDELGYAFKEGETYELLINPQWPDANNNALSGSFSRTFMIGKPITSKAGNFDLLNTPTNNSNTPIELKFNKSHDYALLLRTISVLDNTGQVVEGEITISDAETVWHFQPTRPWGSGVYTIRIENILEDTSGNNLLNSFDVDNREEKTDFSDQKYRASEFRIH